MNQDQAAILIDGIAIGVNLALLFHIAVQIWDGHQDQRAIRRQVQALEARTAAAEGRDEQLQERP